MAFLVSQDDLRAELGAAVGHLQLADSLIEMAIGKPDDAVVLVMSAIAQIKAAYGHIETAMISLGRPPFTLDTSTLDDPIKGGLA